MPVGIVALDLAVGERKEALGSKDLDEILTERFVIDARIAVGLDDHALGREQRPSTIAFDTSAFEDKAKRIGICRLGDEGTREVEGTRNQVVFVGCELHSPAVEGEVHDHGALVALFVRE